MADYLVGRNEGVSPRVQSLLKKLEEHEGVCVFNSKYFVADNPSCLIITYNGTWVGTAYANEFVPLKTNFIRENTDGVQTLVTLVNQVYDKEKELGH